LQTTFRAILANIELPIKTNFMTNRLFYLLRYTAIIALVASLFVLGGCDNEEPGPTKTIYQLISEDPTLAKIKAEIDLDADLKAKLEASTGTYTFFAPNDLAMSAILTTLNLADFTTISKSVLSDVLDYHLANTVVGSGDLTEGKEITTEQGEDIVVGVTSTGSVKLNTGATTDGTVLSTIEGTNGVLHIVGDYPLIPPTIGNVIVATLGTVAQPVLLAETFSILSSAILKADAGKAPQNTIVGAMVGQDAQTFFAIPNQVFQGAPTPITVDSYDAATWDAIIRGHMVPGETIATLGDGTKTTINGKVITTTATTVKGLGNANAIPVVIPQKITMGNGTIFPIGGILLHP
jgi:uncharacterized surface protein with fasciclin (FAS1) repeats